MLRTEGRAAGTWQAGWTIWARSPFWILDCRFWIRHLAGRLDDLGPLSILDFGLPILDSAPGRPVGRFGPAGGREIRLGRRTGGWLRIPCIASVRRHQD